MNEIRRARRKQLHDQGFNVDSELDAGLTINKKVRNAQLAQYNFILVVGEREAGCESVNVRTRDNKVTRMYYHDLIEKFKKFKEEKTINAEEVF